jgi:hypothetical protein
MWVVKDDGVPVDSAFEEANEYGIKILGNNFYELDVNCPNDILPKNQHDNYIMPDMSSETVGQIIDFLGNTA